MADVSSFLQRVLADRADVHVFDRRVRQLLRVVERGQAVEAVVWNLGDADVRLARVGVSLRRQMRLGQNTKQRCLAYLGQANDAGFHKKASSRSILSQDRIYRVLQRAFDNL